MNLFIPGPTQVKQKYLKFMSGPMIEHRGKDYAALHSDVVRHLKNIFKADAHSIFISTSSASGMMEAAIRNCVEENILHTLCGAFSERWLEISELNGKKAAKIEVPWGKAIDPDALKNYLQKNTTEAVAVTHCETSTGILNPLQEVIPVIRKYSDALIFVDAVSSAGGVELNLKDYDIDVLIFGTQKGLALPPGLSFAFVSKRAISKSKNKKNKGYYFNFEILQEFAEKNTTPATPNISLMYALREKLKDIEKEGMEKRIKRHMDMQKEVQKWLNTWSLSFFPDEKYSSPTVSVIKNTLKISSTELCSRLAKHDFAIAPGYGKLKEETFRIGHMGDHTVKEVKELLRWIEKVWE